MQMNTIHYFNSGILSYNKNSEVKMTQHVYALTITMILSLSSLFNIDFRV